MPPSNLDSGAKGPEAHKLFAQMEMILAGKDRYDALNAVLNVLAASVGQLVENAAEADRMLDELLMPQMKQNIRDNWENIQKAKARYSGPATRA